MRVFPEGCGRNHGFLGDFGRPDLAIFRLRGKRQSGRSSPGVLRPLQTSGRIRGYQDWTFESDPEAGFFSIGRTSADNSGPLFLFGSGSSCLNGVNMAKRPTITGLARPIMCRLQAVRLKDWIRGGTVFHEVLKRGSAVKEGGLGETRPCELISLEWFPIIVQSESQSNFTKVPPSCALHELAPGGNLIRHIWVLPRCSDQVFRGDDVHERFFPRL